MRRRREKKGVRVAWQGEVEKQRKSKGEGCQRQGGLSALNGYLVRKVEGEEAQIKDVPSLKRKSSHPSILSGCFKEGGERERWEGRTGGGLVVSAIQSPSRQGCGRFPGCSNHTMPHAAFVIV